VSAVATRRRGGTQLALAPERPRRESFDLDRLRRERSQCSDGGRLTLEQRLDGVWEGLHAAGVAVCPLCSGRMESRRDGLGRCAGCGTTLS
jgi:ribosomal protein L37AE/L43A